MSLHEFKTGLSEKDMAEISSGFKHDMDYTLVSGPNSFYRFVGYNEYGRENEIYGSWWFSKSTFNSFEEGAKRLGISFAEFAKFRLALPDIWNSKLHIFELNLPAGDKIGGIVGSVRYQKDSYTDRDGKQHSFKNVFMIGGEVQYYFKKEQVKKYPVQSIIKF